MTQALLVVVLSLAAAQARTTAATTPPQSAAKPAPATSRPAPAAATTQPAATPKNAEGPGHEEVGQEPSEPPTLESRIPPVSGQEYGVADRFEIQPGIGFSFDDPFLEKFVPQLTLGYHFGEQFYLGLKGGYALSTSAGNVAACNTGGSVCGPPSSTQLQSLPGGMTVIAFLEGGWTPFYGKVNLFGEKVIHFDFTLLLGVGGILAQTPASPDGTTPASSGFAFALGPGIAEHFFLSEHVAIAAELRDYIYFSSGVQNQLMFNLGLSFLLGSGPPQG
jgi:outer membrane beta-barrel protein